MFFTFWRKFSWKKGCGVWRPRPQTLKNRSVLPSSLSKSLFRIRTSPFSPACRGGRWRPLTKFFAFFRPPFSFLIRLCLQFKLYHCTDRVKICWIHQFLADFKATFGLFGPLKFHSSNVGFVKGIQDGRHGVVAAQSKSGALSLNERPREKDLQKGARSSGF